MAANVHGLIQLGGSMIRELDAQNDLKFVRLKLTESEVMIAPYPDFRCVCPAVRAATARATSPTSLVVCIRIVSTSESIEGRA